MQYPSYMIGEKSCVRCTKSFLYIEECYTAQGYAIFVLSLLYILKEFCVGIHKTPPIYRAPMQNFSNIQSPRYAKLLLIEPLDKTCPIYRAPRQNFSYIQSPYTKTSIYRALGTQNFYIQSSQTKLLYIEPRVCKTSPTYRAPTQNFYIERSKIHMA